MRNAYLYNLPISTASDWDCGVRVFVDMPGMNRAERTALIDGEGLHPGDVLVITQLSQLGQGRESTMIQQRIKSIGAAIELRPLAAPVRLAPRKGWLVPTPEQKAHVCGLWRSTQPASYVIQRASEIMGQPVNRAWLNRHCENRSPKKNRD